MLPFVSSPHLSPLTSPLSPLPSFFQSDDIGEDNRNRPHIQELAYRDTGSLHLRVVARALTLTHLERLDSTSRNHLRTMDVTSEPDIATRSFTPLASFPSGEDAGPLLGKAPEVAAMLLERLVQDAIGDSSVLQAFDALDDPPIPTSDGDLPEVPVVEPPILTEVA